MSEKKEILKKEKTLKEKVAYCGSKVLTGASVLAASLTASAPFLSSSVDKKDLVAGLLAISTGFALAANHLGEDKKSEGEKKLQSSLLTIALCGFALATGEGDDFLAHKQMLQDVDDNRPRVQAVATGGTNDPEMEKYWRSIVTGKTLKLEDFMTLAAATAAKDFTTKEIAKEIAVAELSPVEKIQNNNINIALEQRKKNINSYS